jgi:hypothetical protein
MTKKLLLILRLRTMKLKTLKYVMVDDTWFPKL